MKEIDELTKQKSKSKSTLQTLRASEDRNILHRDDPLYMAENASQQVFLFTDLIMLRSYQDVHSQTFYIA
jgi:hypothetical protein